VNWVSDEYLDRPPLRARRIAALGGFIALAGLLLLPTAAGAAAFPTWGFQTPSRNISCVDAVAIQCAIPIAGSCDGTLYRHARLRQDGRARLFKKCDPVRLYESDFFVLEYGERVRREGVRCRSTKRGLRCRNRADRGFHMSRRGSHRI